MRITLIGYGKMGKEIEKFALSRNHTISMKIDIDNASDLDKISPDNTDVAIEFTSPHTAYSNVMKCLERNVAVVCGSTGWNDKLDEAKKLCNAKNGAFLWSSNFSIGVNLFFALNKYLAKIMEPYKQYEPSMTEIHHIHKKDAPSGTAITLAEQILANNTSKKQWKLAPEQASDAIIIEAQRIGEVPGTHIIKYDSGIDCIEIKHEARNRQGLALGAVIAAEFLKGKKGNFSMDDLLNISVS
jgi:4-hydroxy-tetrahydrodipicolinate reductase